MDFRVGLGYDVHRLVPGRKLVLGGVEIAHPTGLDGHSDADCLTHALADAVLGAAGLPDIGHYFPPGDPATRGLYSQVILRKAVAESATLGYRVVNADVAVIAEAPKIGPHRERMKTILAASLGVTPAQVSIKATTNEKLDDVGRGQGIATHAVVLLQRA